MTDPNLSFDSQGDRAHDLTRAEQTIPVVDLQDFLVGSSAQQQRFVETMGKALEEIGFFALVNHGIERALVQSAYQVAQAFFALPEEIKLTYEDRSLNGQRGFTRFGQEHAKDQAAPDLKEFWHVGRDDRLINPRPQEIPAFHGTMQRLYEQLEHCAAQLLEACALYLGEPRNLLREMIVDGDTILRVIHYPPIPVDRDSASVRSAPHEDINLITLLCEATAAGLEIQRRDGSWLAIAACPGQIIVDSGDMLQWLTNGRLRSTTHRVSNPANPQTARFSMPFFVHPRPEVDLTPLPGCIAATGGKAKFPPTTAKAYLQQRLQEIGLAG